jgi:hypothetical protein
MSGVTRRSLRSPFVPPLLVVALFVAGCDLAFVALAAEAKELHATEFGVGTDVVDRELQGRAESFAEGATVAFFIRVEGGQPGDKVDHVWLHEGKEAARISLELGGSPWRTWSKKTLHKGSTGQWKVEARSADGRLLAEGQFNCTAAP